MPSSREKITYLISAVPQDLRRSKARRAPPLHLPQQLQAVLLLATARSTCVPTRTGVRAAAAGDGASISRRGARPPSPGAGAGAGRWFWPPVTLPVGLAGRGHGHRLRSLLGCDPVLFPASLFSLAPLVPVPGQSLQSSLPLLGRLGQSKVDQNACDKTRGESTADVCHTRVGAMDSRCAGGARRAWNMQQSKKKKQIATAVHYISKVVTYPLFALLSGSVGCGLGPAGATWQRRS